MEAQNYLWLVFAVFVAGFLIFDLGFLNRKAHKIGVNSALIQSLFWILSALAYALFIFYALGRDPAAEFMSAYVTEKMLSVDNLFVIALIFSFFKLEEKYYHKVLFWGIMGAIVFRGVFIGAGGYIVGQLHWVLYIFGALLVYTGIKLFNEKKSEHVDFTHNRALRFIKRHLPFTPEHHAGGFWKTVRGKFYFTDLFLILFLVETTDIIFAMDSIPAAFAISQSPFIVFTSNIFAVMGLRALFFVLEGLLHKFHHLQKGLAIILLFIGAKMLLGWFDVHFSSYSSFIFIMAALGASLLASFLWPKKV